MNQQPSPQQGDKPPQQGYPSPAGYAPLQTQQSIQSIPRDLNCPPGLEYLTQIDQILIHSEVEPLEVFTGFENAKKYSIKNSLGQKIYYALEDIDFCDVFCYGHARPFEMMILDNDRREVIHLSRPLACCLQKLEVLSSTGEVFGYVEQDWSLIFPNFSIKNAAKETIFKIKGPLCAKCLCSDVEFEVFAADGETQVGKITKQWAFNFGMTFPMDLDVKMKAVMLGAVFLIDYMFFQRGGILELYDS